ncbi:TadE family protein [Streptomyces endophytica]|uniref:Pilus assembly protein n=1 Tax=Streptomyces endophytica TaxID=2991496 RepID=A0ABY6P7M5_9ACTN|nr:TadE family protein [Streptomyces endophytica]UZJ29799.1 pilus assembly protein [Streptomyces endophytica]
MSRRRAAGAREGSAVRAVPPGGRPGRDRGQASIEFLGFLPILLIVALAVVQLGLAAYTVQQAGTGARAAARTASMDRADRETDPRSAGRAAMSGWVADRATISVSEGGDEVSATARVTIPSIIPGVDDFGSASRSATMPRPRRRRAGRGREHVRRSTPR